MTKFGSRRTYLEKHAQLTKLLDDQIEIQFERSIATHHERPILFTDKVIVCVYLLLPKTQLFRIFCSLYRTFGAEFKKVHTIQNSRLEDEEKGR